MGKPQWTDYSIWKLSMDYSASCIEVLTKEIYFISFITGLVRPGAHSMFFSQKESLPMCSVSKNVVDVEIAMYIFCKRRTESRIFTGLYQIIYIWDEVRHRDLLQDMDVFV